MYAVHCEPIYKGSLPGFSEPGRFCQLICRYLNRKAGFKSSVHHQELSFVTSYTLSWPLESCSWFRDRQLSWQWQFWRLCCHLAKSMSPRNRVLQEKSDWYVTTNVTEWPAIRPWLVVCFPSRPHPHSFSAIRHHACLTIVDIATLNWTQDHFQRPIHAWSSPANIIITSPAWFYCFSVDGKQVYYNNKPWPNRPLRC